MVGHTEYPGVSPGVEVPRGQNLVEHYNAHYGRYIDLVDQLRTFGLEKEVPLPQVVVTGIQSSGKSSVLESISGVSMPRGTGRWCRHCPLWSVIRVNEVIRQSRNPRWKMDKEAFHLLRVQHFYLSIITTFFWSSLIYMSIFILNILNKFTLLTSTQLVNLFH